MEFFDGVPIDDLAQVAELGIDPTPLVEEVMRAFFLTTVRWGAFHGDVHAGNMMLLRDGRIGVIDWGIVGRLDPRTHRFFLALLSAALGNEAAWTDVTRHITDMYGPAIGVAVGLSDDELTGLRPQHLSSHALTRPFGEVSLAGIMQTIQLQMARGPGHRGPPTHPAGDPPPSADAAPRCAGWPTSPAGSCRSSTGGPSCWPSSSCTSSATAGCSSPTSRSSTTEKFLEQLLAGVDLLRPVRRVTGAQVRPPWRT